jgi:uncharacterized protein (UPF0335 family)
MTANTGGVAAGQLKAFVQRLERLDEEKRDISEQIKDVMAEAKSEGFDTKTLREVLKIRRMDAQERAERAETLELYLHALGDLATTPLGKAAIASAQIDIEDAVRQAA